MKKKLATVFFSLFLIIVGIMPMANHEAFAFWSGRNPHHKLITELLVWPQNQELFNKYSMQMGIWSEEPDGHKEWLFAHGDEEKRAMCSFKAAVRHYENYLNDPTKSRELEVAAQCLAHAYHYFENMGDFTEGDKPKRARLGGVIVYVRGTRNSNYSQFRSDVDKKKLYIQNPRDLKNIVQSLEKLKREGKENSATNFSATKESLYWLIACLEQVNERFLAREVSPYLLHKCPN